MGNFPAHKIKYRKLASKQSKEKMKLNPTLFTVLMIMSGLGVTSAEDDLCGCRRRDRHLNQADKVHHARRTVLEEGSEDGSVPYTVSVEVEAVDPDSYGWVRTHFDDMQHKLEANEVPREWDPLFRAYFAHQDKIQSECLHDEESLSCHHTATDECGKDLIQALFAYHDEIRQSIQDDGDHAIMEPHPIPESCLSS